MIHECNAVLFKFIVAKVFQARMAICLGLVAIFGFSAPVAAGAGPAEMVFPHALTPAFRWSEHIEMRLSGLPIVVRGFVATQPLDQVAKTLARHKEKFQRITTLPGSILLSGVHQGRHWVAQLEAVQGRVQGMVSALPLDVDPASKGVEMTGFLAPWLTQNAGFVFGHSSSGSGRGIVQTVHMPHGSSRQFITALDLRLTDAGWRRSGIHSWLPAASNPAVGSGRIDVFPMHDPVLGNAVFIHQSQ